MTNRIVLNYLLQILVLVLLVQEYSLQSQVSTFTDCGGNLRESRGVITTPNFPNAYPVPIYCRWVIEAPEDKVIAVYFTQFYMRDGLRAAEYAFFTDVLHMGKTDYGTLSSDREVTYLVTNKHILVLEFAVRETGNIHLRIRQLFLDVFGFNITYEVIDKTQSIRTDECLYHHCSFTGMCYADANFESYYCSCFDDFFGEECQYNGNCGPTAQDNPCMNGGTCRFYIGSLASTCECPPGYEGMKCEIQKDVDLAQCAASGCAQTCSVNNNEVTCTCLNGYRLADDGKKCVGQGRTRYLVTIKILDLNVDLAHLPVDGARYKQLKKGVENALLSLLKPRLFKVDNLTVISFKPSADVHFHFLADKEDNQQAKIVIEEAIKTGKIGRYAVNRTYLVFDWEPAIIIQGLEASEDMPVVEGIEFNLACVVEGSSENTVEWFKDGAVVDVSTTYRGLWVDRIPKNSKDQTTFLLGFEKTNLLDSGIFTCQVSDWDSVHNKSIHVTVVSVPFPTVDPLTATVNKGDSFVVTCSPPTYGAFGYNWLKNGKILNPSLEPELIEDLFPTGSRLLVHSAKSSVTYTCIITSSAGSTETNSVITVIDKETTPVCQAETYKNIDWSITAANTVQRKTCSVGYTGIVSRRCSSKKEIGAVWDEPDYSSCLSSGFRRIKTQFDSLTMGYRLTELEPIIQELKTYLWDKHNNLHLAEGEPVIELLERILHYNGSTKENIYNQWNVSEAFLDILSFLLETPYLIQKQSHLIKLYKAIVEYGEKQGSLMEVGTFETFVKDTFVLEIGCIPYGSSYQFKFPRHPRKLKKQAEMKNQSWRLTDSVEIEINSKDIESNDNYSLSLAAVFFKNFSDYLPENYISQLGGLDIEYQLHSQPLAISLKTTKGPLKIPDVLVKIKMAHLNQKSRRLKNITCGMANFSENKYSFPMEGCQLISTTGNFTTCQCFNTGMYVLLLTSFSNYKSSNTADGFEVIAGIGCGICAFLLCLTFFILLTLWKKLKGAITALKLQVCIALTGAYVTILKGLHEPLQKEYYSYVMSVIQFFLLATFSMQLCLGLIVYIEFTNLQSIQYPELKVAAMGWAVPTIVVGATLASQVPEGFLLDSWWLKFGTNFFLAYVIAVLIIVMLQLVLFLTVKAEIRHHQKVESPKLKMIMNRTKLLHRSLVIAACLLLTSISSILYINYEDDIFKYLFSFTSAFLGMVIFLCYTFCSENASLLCCPRNSDENEEEKDESKVNTESNSFKSFLKPEIVGETACYLNKFNDHIDKKKQLEQVQKLRQQVEGCREPDWLETGCLLQGRKPQIKVATVHSPIKSKPKTGKGNKLDDVINELEDVHPVTPQKLRWHHIDAAISPAFELEQMYDSPRSNLHGKPLESVMEEDFSSAASCRLPIDCLPPPYHDPGINGRKEYSVHTNPLSSYDSHNPEYLRTDHSALAVMDNKELNKSASSNLDHQSGDMAISPNGRMKDKSKYISPEKGPFMSSNSTPDDNSNPTNSIADLISREDDFATQMEMPLVVTDTLTRKELEQPSPSKKSWSMTAV